MEGAISLTEIGSTSSWKGSNKTRFQYCQNSCGKLLCIRATQGHTRGEMIELEMPVHDLLLPNWKEFVFHRGCSFNLKSTLNARLIGGGREGRETRHTVFFTPLNPRRDEIEEVFKGDLTKPRKVHCNTSWTQAQNAVYWIHLGKAQEKGMSFW